MSEIKEGQAIASCLKNDTSETGAKTSETEANNKVLCALFCQSHTTPQHPRDAASCFTIKGMSPEIARIQEGETKRL
ncbi:hypothetical protein BaRGS_00024454 [Batillaria attramentaria]|uniref:Uncharacterized protein n=1 Tax=Batillaria attramentaria TaxID=370345 RepID=A0ABD0KB27_9CAEN